MRACISSPLDRWKIYLSVYERDSVRDLTREWQCCQECYFLLRRDAALSRGVIWSAPSKQRSMANFTCECCTDLWSIRLQKSELLMMWDLRQIFWLISLKMQFVGAGVVFLPRNAGVAGARSDIVRVWKDDGVPALPSYANIWMPAYPWENSAGVVLGYHTSCATQLIWTLQSCWSMLRVPMSCRCDCLSIFLVRWNWMKTLLAPWCAFATQVARLGIWLAIGSLNASAPAWSWHQLESRCLHFMFETLKGMLNKCRLSCRA